jgi:hypothetical protein
MMLERSNEEVFLDLMREETGDSSLSIESAMALPLAGTVLRTISRSAESRELINSNIAPALAESSLSEMYGNPAILNTAIEDTFDIRELSLSKEEHRALLDVSDIVMIGGERRLRLRDGSRAEVLDATKGSDLYEKLLSERVHKDDEHSERSFEVAGSAAADEQKGYVSEATTSKEAIRGPGVWLRRFLVGRVTELATAEPSELKVALDARERLRYLRTLPEQIPSIDELARRTALAELLEPLRLLIGARQGRDGEPATDRFVGRQDELKRLRAFVDEVSSQSFTESLERGLSRVKRTLVRDDGPGILIIHGRGGLGKSTLLAKFVLDHALGQQRPFPFAYLDFDRAALEPRRPRQLLIEIARQIGLQFPSATAKLANLSESIRAAFVGTTQTPNSSYGISDPFAAFAEILREHATFGQRAFLLVFDTMEAVQWDTVAMDQLASLLYEFRAKGVDELRVVVSGRADVPELRRARGPGNPKNSRELEPLRIDEARQLADALGQAAIGGEWNPEWSVVAIGRRQDNIRREPLAVRVTVDLITRANKEDRPGIVQELSEFGPEANHDYVARLYLKRVVNHVRDPLARKLAWPGLVVRRLTVDIVRELLAPLCNIEPDQAERAFEALGQEVWMVTREGNALRHRQDLRARTLPLMRAATTDITGTGNGGTPVAFNDVVLEAVKYFGKYRSRSEEDHAEWIYQRLLMGESPESVAVDLKEDLLSLLGRAAEDFPADSPAASYLASRTASSRLAPSRIRSLRSRDALYHLSRTSASVFALDDLSLDPVTLDVSRRIATTSDFDSSLIGWAQALWIKTGAWAQVANQEIRLESLNHQLLRAHLYWAARQTVASPQDKSGRLIHEYLHLGSFVTEDIGVRSRAQVLAISRLSGSDKFREIDRDLARDLSKMKPNPIPSSEAALRTAIIFGEASRRPALDVWLGGRRYGSGDRVLLPCVSLREVKALTRIIPESEKLFYQLLNAAEDAPARFTDPESVNFVDRMFDELISDSDGVSERAALVSRLFACRDEDWIVPMGYSAARAYERPLSRTLAGYLEFYDRVNREKRPVDSQTDMVASMRIADQAGDLNGFANLVVAECDPELQETREFVSLLHSLDVWHQRIEGITGAIEPPRLDSQYPASLFSRTMAKIRSVVGIEDEAPTSPISAPETAKDRPPEPGPIINRDDPQKGRWGGEPMRDGRQVSVTIESVERDIFYFSVFVQSTDGSPLASPVVFHLHDTFPRSIITIRRIENQQAALRSWNAYGVFTIGVQVKNVSGQWVSLEIDLANAPGIPKRFLSR